MLTVERLKEIVIFNSETGDFTWRVSVTRRKAGTKATRRPYVQFCIDGKLHYAHRLAWLYVYGVWPSGEIDHINCDPADNRICNLRDCAHVDNMANRGAERGNKLGVKGVCAVPSGKFMAQIMRAGKMHYLGLFATAESAGQAYIKAASALNGDFARS